MKSEESQTLRRIWGQSIGRRGTKAWGIATGSARK